MKLIFAVSRLIAAAGAALIFSASVQAAPPTPGLFPIADVVAQVKTELAAAQATTGGDLGISLQKVQLTFALTKSPIQKFLKRSNILRFAS